MSRRMKIAHLLKANVKKRIWQVKRLGENLQNEMLSQLRRPHSLEREVKLEFFTFRGLLNKKYDIFRGKKPF